MKWARVEVDISDEHPWGGFKQIRVRETDVEVMTENNGWAIVWMHQKYFVRHVKPEGCGTFLRGNAVKGCTCRGKNKSEPVQVDPTVLAKFRILTFRENLK